jgi:hypothetical protein
MYMRERMDDLCELLNALENVYDVSRHNALDIEYSLELDATIAKLQKALCQACLAKQKDQ